MNILIQEIFLNFKFCNGTIQASDFCKRICKRMLYSVLTAKKNKAIKKKSKTVLESIDICAKKIESRDTEAALSIMGYISNSGVQISGDEFGKETSDIALEALVEDLVDDKKIKGGSVENCILTSKIFDYGEFNPYPSGGISSFGR